MVIVEDLSKRLYKQSKEVLLKHKELTDRIVDKLMSDYVLSVDEAIIIVSEYFEGNTSHLKPYLNKDNIVYLKEAN